MLLCIYNTSLCFYHQAQASYRAQLDTLRSEADALRKLLATQDSVLANKERELLKLQSALSVQVQGGGKSKESDVSTCHTSTHSGCYQT